MGRSEETMRQGQQRPARPGTGDVAFATPCRLVHGVRQGFKSGNACVSNRRPSSHVYRQKLERKRGHIVSPYVMSAGEDGGGGGGGNADASQSQSEEVWRPHTVTGKDSTDEMSDKVPIELAEGFLAEEGARPRFDMDADETMMLFKMRRMLHKDDFKRIFEHPRVGEM